MEDYRHRLELLGIQLFLVMPISTLSNTLITKPTVFGKRKLQGEVPTTRLLHSSKDTVWMGKPQSF